MDDIVTRLREWSDMFQSGYAKNLTSDAADEIERLRAERNGWQATAAGLSEDIGNAEDELADYRRTVRALEEELNSLLQAQSGWGRVPRLEAEIARLTSVLESWGISSE